ncbi:General transcription factor II-I repeat domain-containing protein 2A [Eumeta japonica]|uniref:General transcription factor II-I repeat domain-containing protein 2A n=1 Tax=Eumeta variegata TaxID=151549 RepID=A0A4C1TC14_EUMVA|nr:General transcription factor II-I repeat domain-containing protein 2A [Eumeta japonica]
MRKLNDDEGTSRPPSDRGLRACTPRAPGLRPACTDDYREHSFSNLFNINERTDLSDRARLAIFIRGVDKESTVTEELLTLQPLKGTTTGEDIFNEVQKAQMLSGNSYHFTTLFAYENIAYAQYAEELKLLSEQFSNRLSDFKSTQDCFNLFTTPTKMNVQNSPIHLQTELIEIQENSQLKSKFEDVVLCDFYKKYLEEDHFPQLRKFTRSLILTVLKLKVRRGAEARAAIRTEIKNGTRVEIECETAIVTVSKSGTISGQELKARRD